MIKVLLLIALIFSMGCQTMATMMKGMGDGLTSSSNNYNQSRSVNCTTTGSAGFYNTTCN